MTHQERQDRMDEIIVELHAGELSIAKIAQEFGVKKQYIYMVNAGTKGRMDNYRYPIRDFKDSLPNEAPTDDYGEPL